MLEKSYESLRKKENLRETLQFLRTQAKDETAARRMRELSGDGAVLTELLVQSDPKVRKGAALLIGELSLQQAVPQLFEAYRNEDTLFVKSAYLTAMGRLDASCYLDWFKERMQTLSAAVPAENEKKHWNEELRELGKVITGIEGAEKHTFVGFSQPHELLLVTGHDRREVTAQEAAALSAGICKKITRHPLGVLVYTKEVLPVAGLRTYRELFFPIHTKQNLTQDAKLAAKEIWNSDLWQILTECHSQPQPFFFRAELRGRAEAREKAAFVKQFAAHLEQESGRKLVNSTGDYEVRLILMQKKDGTLDAFFGLSTIPIKRFSYRKNVVSTSMHPSLAASLALLAKPYLEEGAQILDPFCGVGTMLIERDRTVPAREKYGIDIFGEAVKGARENASAAGEKINFIHRDYFDFQHAYLFDEIITDMPVLSRQTREETDAFYAKFFEKSKSILAPGGKMIFYSNEEGIVKKQLRLHPEYRLLQEFVIRKKHHFCLYIVEMKG